MTNSRSNLNGRGGWNAQTSQGTSSPTSEYTEVTVSVEDIKSFLFTYDKKLLDNHIVSSERFLMYAGAKFGACEQLSLEHGELIIHNAVKPLDLVDQSVYDALSFTERKTWDLDLKNWNLKKGKTLDNISQLYPTLWNQCTLPLKSKLQGHDKYAKVESHKNTIKLWKFIEEIYSSTSLINSVVQRALKADLSIGNIYGENMELAK